MKKLLILACAFVTSSCIYSNIFENELDLVATPSLDAGPSDYEIAQFEAELAQLAQEAKEVDAAKKLLNNEDVADEEVFVEEDNSEEPVMITQEEDFEVEE